MYSRTRGVREKSGWERWQHKYQNMKSQRRIGALYNRSQKGLPPVEANELPLRGGIGIDNDCHAHRFHHVITTKAFSSFTKGFQ